MPSAVCAKQFPVDPLERRASTPTSAPPSSKSSSKRKQTAVPGDVPEAAELRRQCDCSSKVLKGSPTPPQPLPLLGCCCPFFCKDGFWKNSLGSSWVVRFARWRQMQKVRCADWLNLQLEYDEWFASFYCVVV